MWSAITRRDGAAFAHNAAGFLDEHHRHASRWDLAAVARDLHGTVALYDGGSDEDPYEHRQIPATRRRAPQVEVLTFPGGHLTTSEHPDLLAAEIRRIAARHGVGTPGPHPAPPKLAHVDTSLGKPPATKDCEGIGQ